MHMRLREIWTDFRDDPKLRVAILTGAGDAFCAGADLKTHVPEWADVGPSLARDKLPDGFAGGITRGLHRLYKPIIAACNGWVLGGGLELAMACDIRIASERAQFGSFELRRGMHPADGGIVRLVNTCGVGIALEMELTGEPITRSARACGQHGVEGRASRRAHGGGRGHGREASCATIDARSNPPKRPSSR